VSNVIRHSGGTSLAIAIASDGKRIRLTIEDDGRGFDTDAIRTGNGLANMAARAAGLGGAVDISSSETGTILAAQVPISKSSAAASSIE
jgi:hypothetical protein